MKILPKVLKHISLFLFVLIFFLSTPSLPTHAISKENTKYRYIIREKGVTTVEITTKVTDREPNKFVRKISLNLPQTNISNFQALLNGDVLAFSITGNNVSVNIPDKYVTSIEDLNLKYTYLTSDVIESYGSLLNIYIPSSLDVSNGEYINEIVYDSKLGKPSFVSEFNYDLVESSTTNTLKLKSITNPNGALISLGDKQYYDIGIKYGSLGESEDRVALNLPSISHNQDMYFYTDIDVSNKIVRDNYDNDFLQMSQKDGIDLGIELVKYGNKSISNYKIPKSKFWKTSTTKLENLVSSIGRSKGIIDISNYLKSKYTYKESEINEDLTLDKIIDKTELNSYELSYLFSNILEKLGYESELKAGIYMGGDNVVNLGNKLWFWNSYIENNTLKEIDISLYIATGFNYISNFDLSHISFLNYSDPTVNYTFKDYTMPSSYRISASINPKFGVENEPRLLLELLNSSNVVTSGVDSYSKLKLTNTGSRVVELENINVDGVKVDLNDEIILYPKASKEIIVNLKNSDWNYEGSRNVKIDIKIFGLNEISQSFIIKYVKSNLIVVFAWILRILFSIVISTILFIVLKYILFKQFHFRFDK